MTESIDTIVGSVDYLAQITHQADPEKYPPVDFEIIGFSGKMGSGKNFLSEKIFLSYLEPKPTMVVSFADHFKIDGIIKGGLDRDRVFGSNKDDHTRRVLQIMGTEEGRNKYGEYIWCHTAYEWMVMQNQRGIQRFLIPDVRFKNEVEFLKGIGATVFRIEAANRNEDALRRESKGNDDIYNKISTHPSETDLDDYGNWDGLIPNDYDDDPFTPLRDYALAFEQTYNNKNQPEDIIFVDLDDTICECSIHYTKRIEHFVHHVRTVLNMSSDSEEFKQFSAQFKKLTSSRYYDDLYSRKGLPDSMKDAVTWLQNQGYEHDDWDELKRDAFDIGMDVHYSDFKELHDSVKALRRLSEHKTVVLFTLGHRADQLRKIYRLGIFDLSFEVVDTRKNTQAYEILKRKYPAKRHHKIGDSYHRDVIPALEAGFDSVWHIKVDDGTDYLEDNQRLNNKHGYSYHSVHTLEQAVDMILDS